MHGEAYNINNQILCQANQAWPFILYRILSQSSSQLNSLIFHSSMPKRAQSQIRKRIEGSGQPPKLQQLCLDGISIRNFTANIKRLIQSCTNLEYLTLNDTELKSLDNFPKLPQLVVLEITDNQLTGEDLNKLTTSPQLKFLTLVNNHITSLNSLTQLKPLPQLEILEIHSNPICEEENYRQEILNMLPTLNVVDCIDRQGCKVEEESPSEYISNVGNSRLDLLDLLQDSNQKEHSEDFVKTAVGYLQDGPIDKRDSIQTSISPITSNINAQPRPSFNQKSIMFMRIAMASDSDQDQKDEMIRDFKRKFHKKDE